MEATQEKRRNNKQQSALRPLLESLIDYAGLFPPAGLAMEAAVQNYARYKAGPYAWMLGRFVVPVSRLAEFENAREAIGAPSGWPLSALVADTSSELPMVHAFNARNAGQVTIDALELKAANLEDIQKLREKVLDGITAYIEIPVNENLASLLSATRVAGLRAKIRTGGLTAELFPQAFVIARFLHECHASGVAFKATAGLHHPLRCVKAFTYEPDSPSGKMHGFLNVFLAAVLARKGAAVAVLEKLLLEEDSHALQFSADGLQWRDEHLTVTDIQDARKAFAVAFGSCSFEEPISDLQALELLP